MEQSTKPPPVLDGARVLSYAVVDESVTYTGETSLIIGGRVQQPARCFAICQNLDDRKYLLFYCTADWYVVGAAFIPSVNGGRDYAERGYRGLRAKWVEAGTTEAIAREFLNRDTSGLSCSFCGNRPKDGAELTFGPTAAVCDDCFRKTYALFEAEGLV